MAGSRRKWGIAGLAAAVVGGLGLLASRAALDTNPLVLRWFGPPVQTMREAYADDSARATFSHAPFARVLGAYVHDGRVDYEGLAAHPDDLEAYVDALAEAPFDGLDRNGKLALLINAYNAFTLTLIVEHYPLTSIKDIPASDRWDAKRWKLGGRTVSLTQLEHEELRQKFVEPRIHFAINCASIGCPPLRSEAYLPERLEPQLEAATQAMHDDVRWLRLQQNSALSYDTVHLTKLYAWYASDFTQVAGSPLAFAARYRPELGEGEWRIEWLDYDWHLNGQLRDSP